jgi:hypothetical protein
MRADKNIAAYRRMRNQPLWRLLASGNGPTVIGLLQSHLYEKERCLPASILFGRLTRDLGAMAQACFQHRQDLYRLWQLHEGDSQF